MKLWTLVRAWLHRDGQDHQKHIADNVISLLSVSPDQWRAGSFSRLHHQPSGLQVDPGIDWFDTSVRQGDFGAETDLGWRNGWRVRRAVKRWRNSHFTPKIASATREQLLANLRDHIR